MSHARLDLSSLTVLLRWASPTHKIDLSLEGSEIRSPSHTSKPSGSLVKVVSAINNYLHTEQGKQYFSQELGQAKGAILWSNLQIVNDKVRKHNSWGLYFCDWISWFRGLYSGNYTTRLWTTLDQTTLSQCKKQANEADLTALEGKAEWEVYQTAKMFEFRGKEQAVSDLLDALKSKRADLLDDPDWFNISFNHINESADTIEAVIDDILTNKSDNLELFQLCARACCSIKDKDKALQILVKMLELDPFNIRSFKLCVAEFRIILDHCSDTSDWRCCINEI